jgi:hypothetical protein
MTQVAVIRAGRRNLELKVRTSEVSSCKKERLLLVLSQTFDSRLIVAPAT